MPKSGADDTIAVCCCWHLTFERTDMTTKTSTPIAPVSPMTQAAASRIQSTTARSNGGGVPKGSFAARAQRAAAKGGNR